MSLNVFSGPLPRYAFGIQLLRPSTVTTFGSQVQQRATRSGRTYRIFSYLWEGLTDAEKAAFDAFFVGQSMNVTSFLWRDPSSDDTAETWHRSGISCGTAIAAQVLFALPTGASEYAGDYPLSTGVVLKADGAVVTVSSVSTDSRTITASSAPGAGKVMTAEYAFYRRVVLDQPYAWARGDSGLWSTAASFREVPS